MANHRVREYTSQYQAVSVAEILKAVKDEKISVERLPSSFTVQRGNISHEIELCKQPVNFGGVRLFLYCPCCGSRRKKLYFKNDLVGCRECLGLHYKSMSESEYKRNYRKLDKIIKYKVGSIDEGMSKRWGTVYKLPYKHNRKFYQYASEVHQLRIKADRLMAAQFDRYFSSFLNLS